MYSSSGEVFGQNFFLDALLLFSSELPFIRDFAEYVLFSITGPDYEQFDKVFHFVGSSQL